MGQPEKINREIQKALECREKGKLLGDSDWKKFRQYKEKYEKHMIAAAEYDADAAYQLAIYYSARNYDWNQTEFVLEYDGTRHQRYRSKAIEWLIKAAEAGCVEAMETLGRQYKKDANDELALFWLQKAENKGHKRAWQTIYEIQRKADKEKAFLLLEEHESEVEAERGWYAGELAKEYSERGEKEKAIQLYSVMAASGNSAAMTALGGEHYCKKEYEQAIKWYQKAILLGNVQARERFEECVALKQGITEADAFRWYQELQHQKREPSAKGFSRSVSAWAAERCGIAYLDGIGVTADRNKAFSLLSSLESFAVSSGSVYFEQKADELSVEGHARLGDCYYYGYGTARNYRQAAMHYEEVNPYSEKGWGFRTKNIISLLRISGLTWCYYMEKAYDKAIPMLKALIEVSEKGEVEFVDGLWCRYIVPVRQKYQWAYEALGSCYLNGTGVPQDRRQAFSLFERAVKNGAGGMARYYLGHCCENGYGTVKNSGLALQWYREAAEGGVKAAAERVRILEAALNKSTRAASGTNKAEDSAVTKRGEPSKNEVKFQGKTGEARKKLDSLIGLQSVKDAVTLMENQIVGNRLRKAQGLSEVRTTKHMVFTGNPGTGKTTVARIVAEILKENGVLSKGQLIETDAEGLIEGYIRQTAAKTAAKVKEAIGGVLFIDEAYGLVAKDDAKDFGPEAITTLVKMMDDHRDDLIVIVAGYKGKMKSFIDANEGLKSRFTTYIDFPDYTVQEMQQIYDRMVKREKYFVTDGARVRLMTLWEESKDHENFGNGRGVRNVFEKTQAKQLSRVVRQGLTDRVSLSTVLAEDIPTADEVFTDL